MSIQFVCSSTFIMAIACAVSCTDERPAEPVPPGEIRVTSLAIATSEAGGAVTIEVALTAPPTAPVVIGVSVDDPGEGAVSLDAVRFAAGEVGPVQFEVAGVNDNITDGAQPFQLRFAPAVSNDARYSGAVLRTLAFSNADDEIAMGMLDVTTLGRGAGAVASFPPGIACPGTCRASFPIGTRVTLSHAAAGASQFGGWVAGRPSNPANFEPTFAVPITPLGAQVFARFVIDDFAWTAAVDGAANEVLSTSAASADSVYAGGHFDGPTIVGGQPLPHDGGRDAIVAARSTADGVARWTVAFGGTGNATIDAIAVVDAGDVVVGGTFDGELELGTAVIEASGAGTRSFVARLAGGGGAIQWATVLAAGPTSRLAALGATDGGGFVACGEGAAPLAIFDKSGAHLASSEPSLLAKCHALARRGGGWFAAGTDGADPGAAAPVFTSFDDNLALAANAFVFTAGGVYAIDDLIAVPGGAVFALGGAGSAVDGAQLVRVNEAGSVQNVVSLTGGNVFDRTISMVRISDSVIVAHDATGDSLVIEHRDFTLLPKTIDKLDYAAPQRLDLSALGDRCFLAATGADAAPLLGWPLLIDPVGGFATELRLRL